MAHVYEKNRNDKEKICDNCGKVIEAYARLYSTENGAICEDCWIALINASVPDGFIMR